MRPSIRLILQSIRGTNRVSTPGFIAPLKSSAILERGVGNPTFTRATTKRIADHEGILRTIKAGETGFSGARRVANVSAGGNTETLAVWTQLAGATKSTTSDTPPFASAAITVCHLTFTAQYDGLRQSGSVSAQVGDTFLMSVWIKRISGNSTLHSVFTESGGGNKYTIAAFAITDEWVRYSLLVTVSQAGTTNISWELQDRNASGFGIVVMSGAQFENVTGQSVQTAAEYVSVGVASSPAYHGAMVDGVKYFPTTLAGAAIPESTLLGYSAEPVATNIQRYSQFPAASDWLTSVNQVTVTPNIHVAPDGTTTMAKILATAGNAAHRFNGNTANLIFTTTAAPYIVSFYAKYVNNQWMSVILNDGTTNFYAVFDLLNGAVGVKSAATTSAITALGGGVYRCTMTVTPVAYAGSFLYFTIENANGSFATWNAAGTETYGLWGVDVELGSFASSYISTTTIAVQRNADVLSYPSAGNASWAAGSFVAEVTAYARGISHYVIQADDGTNSNRVWLSSPDANGNRTLASTGGGSIIMPSTYAVGVLSKIGCSWKTAGQMNTFMDGSAGAGTAYTTPAGTLSTIRIGTNQIVANLELRGNIKNVRIWQTQLSDAILQGITA